MGSKPKDSLHPSVTTAQLPCWSPVISSKAGPPFPWPHHLHPQLLFSAREVCWAPAQLLDPGLAHGCIKPGHTLWGRPQAPGAEGSPTQQMSQADR